MNKIHFESIDSTNTYIKNNYLKLDNFTFVSADNQTQGKGRMDRKWESDSGNLLFSILLKDQRYYDYINSISIISSYTIIKVLEKYGIDNLYIKWPNDIYYKDNKLCGILLESISTDKLECLIIGVGLNVNQKIFDGNYIQKPTSLINILNKEIDIDILKSKIYDEFINNLNLLINNLDFYNDINKYDYLAGKDVYALVNSVKTLVHVNGINKDYTLCVNYENTEYSINSGEISFHI